jgi:hypothetical protein
MEQTSNKAVTSEMEMQEMVAKMQEMVAKVEAAVSKTDSTKVTKTVYISTPMDLSEILLNNVKEVEGGLVTVTLTNEQFNAVVNDVTQMKQRKDYARKYYHTRKQQDDPPAIKQARPRGRPRKTVDTTSPTSSDESTLPISSVESTLPKQMIKPQIILPKPVSVNKTAVADH